MASRFHRTMRSLEHERARTGRARLAAAVLVLAAWATWMHLARVSVYATTGHARLEVSRMVHRAAAPEAGKVARIDLELGRAVAEGEILVELDATLEGDKLAEHETHLAALTPKLEAVARQISAEEHVRRWQKRVGAASIARAEVDVREKEAAATSGEELGEISRRLHDGQLASRMEHITALSRAKGERLQAEGAHIELDRLVVTRGFDDARAEAQIAQLTRQLRDLEGEQSAARAAVDTARAELERRKVRAPAAGRLGSIAALQVGDVVKAGDVLATVIPSEDIHAVAEVDTQEAAGRVAPGQRARMRLAGFSWAEFGMLDAVVRHVATEPRNGTIRVELEVRPESAQAIPVQHGLPGSIEIEVDRASPLRLLLRSVGTLR